MNVDADALSRLTRGSSVSVCPQLVSCMHPPDRNDSWFWTWPIPKKSCHLRVTSYLTLFRSLSNHVVSAAKPKWEAKALYPNFAHAVPPPCHKNARKRKSFRHGYTCLDRHVLRSDLTCSPLQLSLVPSSARGPAPFALARAGPIQASGAVDNCALFAPTTGAQSAVLLDHSTIERTSPRADLESWFRRAARGHVGRVLGDCVSAKTITHRDFPRKPVKKSRVAQPVVEALDVASIIVAYEKDTCAHRSARPRESRLRTWGRLHFLLVR